MAKPPSPKYDALRAMREQNAAAREIKPPARTPKPKSKAQVVVKAPLVERT